MRFKINLASQPYENARRFFTQWGVALVALFIVSGLLVFAAAKSWRVSHSLNRSLSEERDRLDKLNAQEKADLEILNRDQNRDVRERSQAINGLILRKEFSWTRIFSDLEKLMPTRLHIVAITPQLTPADQIEIHMQVAGDSREKAIEFLRNMEKAPDFQDARMLAETAAPKGSAGDPINFEITAVYVPAVANAISEAEKTAASSEPPPSTTQSTTTESSKANPKPATNDEKPAGGRK
jgi:hypothetical protein